jgi:hypothetical protein
MFQFSTYIIRHSRQGNDASPEARLVSGHEEGIREEHHPREGFRGRFETHEKDRRRLSSLLLLELQRHTRVLHDETVSEEEFVTGAL